MAKKKTRAKQAHKRTAKRKKVAARKQPRSAAKVRAASRKPAPRKRASKKRAPRTLRNDNARTFGFRAEANQVREIDRGAAGRRCCSTTGSNVPQTRGFDDKVGEWTDVRALGAVDLAPIFTDVANVDRIEARARHTEPDYPWPRFRNAFFLHLKPGADTQRVLRLLNNRPDIIRWAYEDAEPGPAASQAACIGPSGHLDAIQVGVAAQAAWDVEGGLGEHQICVDLEQGWVTHARLAHPELVELLCGTMLEVALDHGTQVLGILAGSHLLPGCRGLAPEAAAFRLASFLPQAAVNANLLTVPQPNAVPPATSIYDAFTEAVKFLHDPNGQFPNSAGGVLLIERQRPTDGLPMEILPLLRVLIRAATHTDGITVVEPAGNGFGTNLDLVPGLPGSSSAFPLARLRGDDDSGAIMVGSASKALTAPPGAHRRLLSSNLGSRVDCYAWGDGIRTPTFVFGPGGSIPAVSAQCDDNFGMTSGAAAIIAGVALQLQGIAAAHNVALSPSDLRDLICDPALGTPALAPVGKPPPARIGSMPDLAKILGPGPTAFPARFGVILRKRPPR